MDREMNLGEGRNLSQYGSGRGRGRGLSRVQGSDGAMA